MSLFLALLKRDLTLAVREGAALGTALGFFLVVVAMLPLGLGPDLKLLSRIAPGILWIALLLAALLSLPRLFEADHEDGSLEVMLNLDLGLTPALVATMLAGTPAISFLGSVGAALTLKARRGGLLLALLVLPLYVPTLIFGISAIGFAGLGQDGFAASFLILSAISLASMALAPIAAAAAIRLQMS